jgi:polar amino acid transport system substrate-binding protein
MSVLRTFAFLIWLSLSASVSAQAFLVAYGEDYSPLSFRDGNQTKGLLVDLMDELGRRTGLQTKAVALPWARAQASVKSGEADAFISVTTPAREEYSQAVPTPVIVNFVIAATSASHPQIGELRHIATVTDLLRYRHVNYLGSGWAHEHLDSTPISYLSNFESIFQFLILGRADLLVEDRITVEYNLSRLGLNNEIEILPAVFDKVEFRILVSKKSPFVERVAEMDAALKAMSRDGTTRSILAKWGVRS